MHNALSDEITRQSAYVAGERNNLVTLALAIQNGQLYGPSLANRQVAPAAAVAAPHRAGTAPRAARAEPRAARRRPRRARATGRWS